MVICFPGFYIELSIICTVQTVICIELYTYNPDTQSYAHIIIPYMSSDTSVIIQKTKVCHK